MSNASPQSKIGKNIKNIRQEKGISQDRLSKLTDLSLNTVVTVESGANPNPTFVLNLLSMDENFNVRTLSACNSNTPVNSLRRLSEGANDYVRMVIANNPNSPSDILDRISELSGEQEVLDAVKANQNTSSVTRYKIENRM